MHHVHDGVTTSCHINLLSSFSNNLSNVISVVLSVASLKYLSPTNLYLISYKGAFALSYPYVCI